MPRDVYFKKEVSLEYVGHKLRFRVVQDLFSSFEVDVGTRLLLRSLAEAGRDDLRKVLDLGCGYGPIGLALKMSDEERTVHMVDRDALAVEYSRQNADLNHLPGVEIYGSLGYDDVSARDFDLIASNIPAKAGEPVIANLLREASRYLRPGGLVAIVVIAPIAAGTSAVLAATPSIEVVFHKATARYAVFHYRFHETQEASPPTSVAFDRGIYNSGNVTASLGGLRYNLETSHDLPELEAAGVPGQLLVEALRSMDGPPPRSTIVFGPGQGHVPVALWMLLRPESLGLVDRDLLGLRRAEANLLLNGCPASRIALSHQVGLHTGSRQQADLIVSTPRESEGSRALALSMHQVSQRLSPHGTVLVAATSTAATRLAKALRPAKTLRVASRKRRRGHSLLALAHARSGQESCETI